MAQAGGELPSVWPDPHLASRPRALLAPRLRLEGEAGSTAGGLARDQSWRRAEREVPLRAGSPLCPLKGAASRGWVWAAGRRLTAPLGLPLLAEGQPLARQQLAPSYL